MISNAFYWAKDHAGLVVAGALAMLFAGMMVFSLAFASQQGDEAAEDQGNPGYEGAWYHCEGGDMYVLTLFGDGSARYYDQTLVQPLNYGVWDVQEDGKVLFSDPVGEQPSSASDEFAFYTTPTEDGALPATPTTLTYKGSFSSNQKWLFYPSREDAAADWDDRNPNKATVGVSQ